MNLQAFRAATLLKETPTQVFSCEYCGSPKKSYSEKHPVTSTTCFRNPEKPTTSNLILKNKSKTVNICAFLKLVFLVFIKPP